MTLLNTNRNLKKIWESAIENQVRIISQELSEQKIQEKTKQLLNNPSILSRFFDFSSDWENPDYSAPELVKSGIPETTMVVEAKKSWVKSLDSFDIRLLYFLRGRIIYRFKNINNRFSVDNEENADTKFIDGETNIVFETLDPFGINGSGSARFRKGLSIITRDVNISEFKPRIELDNIKKVDIIAFLYVRNPDVGDWDRGAWHLPPPENYKHIYPLPEFQVKLELKIVNPLLYD